MSKKTTNNSISEKESEALAETFVSKLGQIKLSPTEAQEMRERLIAYSNLHSVPEAVHALPVRSIYFSYLTSSSRFLTASALIILILVSGTGVSYAAENTLPGQPLYGVKVAIVEPIQGALITTTAGQANWQNELTERRLTEASTLAAQNNLSSSTQEYLAEAVSTHVALAQEDAASLADTGNGDAALAVRSDLDASLSAHADLLASVAPRLKAAGDINTSNAVVALLTTVQANQAQVDSSRVATEVALGDTSAANPTIMATNTSKASPAQSKVIALVNAQNSARVAEESTILKKNVALFKLLPIASTTATSTATSSEATTTYPFYRLHTIHPILPPAPTNP